MNKTEYADRKGRRFSLANLNADESALIGELKAYGAVHDGVAFRNFYMPRLNEFYSARGLNRKEIIDTAAWQIAQDIAGRLAIAEGWAGPGDYCDEIVRTRFFTRRTFCEATGISEDMLNEGFGWTKTPGEQAP